MKRSDRYATPPLKPIREKTIFRPSLRVEISTLPYDFSSLVFNDPNRKAVYLTPQKRPQPASARLGSLKLTFQPNPRGLPVASSQLTTDHPQRTNRLKTPVNSLNFGYSRLNPLTRINFPPRPCVRMRCKTVDRQRISEICSSSRLPRHAPRTPQHFPIRGQSQSKSVKPNFLLIHF
jgi:hypothetical protein